jgi:hypothetical protein
VLALALVLSAVLGVDGAAAGESAAPEPATARSIPDLHLSISEVPGEMSVRLPLGSDGYRLYGLLNPYLSLGSATVLDAPWTATLAPGLRRDADGLDDVRLGAGIALPLSERAQLYGEYRFLRGRVDGSLGHGMLQREPDSSDFRAGFSIRLD